MTCRIIPVLPRSSTNFSGFNIGAELHHFGNLIPIDVGINIDNQTFGSRETDLF